MATYKIERKNADNTWSVVHNGAITPDGEGNLLWTDTNGIPNKEYTYRVTQINEGGVPGTVSDPATGRTSPLGILLNNATPTTFDAIWDRITSNVTSYNLRHTTTDPESGTPNWTTITGAGATSGTDKMKATVQDLSPDTQYWVEIQCVGATGTGDWSTTQSIRTQYAVPGQPILTVHAVAQTSITLKVIPSTT